jgi:hypothetical protein
MTAADEQDPFIYFVHGSTSALWNSAVPIDGDQGRGDFGRGFYVFEDTNWGRRSASIWARRKAVDASGVAILIRVKIRRSALLALDREEVSDEALTTAYNRMRGTRKTGRQLIVGPVSRRGRDGERIPERSLPRQFKFEGSAVLNLTIDEIINVQ